MKFMARCTNCNYKWKAREILLLGFSKNGKNCPHCGETRSFFTLGYLSLKSYIRSFSSFSYQIKQ